jgi:hypothetical protein
VAKSWRTTGKVTIGLDKGQLAFLRGHLDGLALPVLGRRYLSTGKDLDLRVLKSHLKSIREQVLVIGQRGGREFRDVRLLLIDPEKLRSTGGQVMTLEEFRHDRDPYEMYSESELLELYEEAMAQATPDRRSQRNERLRRRQVAVLSHLEKLIHANPHPNDGVAGWLKPALAARLVAAGVPTLGDLVRLINERGYWWWTQVPAVGEKVAVVLVDWLRTPYVAKSLGMTIEPHALVKLTTLADDARPSIEQLRSASSGIAPIETFAPPAKFAADREAVLEWLDRHKAKPATYRAYRKEAERLLLFATLEQRRPLTSLRLEDCAPYLDTYIEFLRLLAPGKTNSWPYQIPADEWIGDPRAKRWTGRWRPFGGALSAKSIKLAQDVCQNLMKNLVDN